MRKPGKNQKGFSILEVMVGLTLLLAVFGFSFKNLKELRKGLQRTTTTGPHLFFESFAVSRLKLYFAKVMQWNTHVCRDGSADPNCICLNAAYFAYSPINSTLLSGNGGSNIGNMTLGTDMRLALSTFRIQDVAPNGDSAPFKTLLEVSKAKGAVANEIPWGTMIPFHTVDEWNNANPFSRNWCAKRKPVAGSVGDEMCKQFDACAQVAGGLGGARPTNQLGTQSGARDSLVGVNNFSMCFVFAGNLFSRSDNENITNQSLGLAALDHPAVVGLVVAKAKFVNNANQQPLTCETAAVEMNRSLKVNLEIYTALNADNTDAKKQTAQKSIREITGEKLGVAAPNCNAPSRGGLSAVNGKSVCLEDPTYIYQCSNSCTFF
jgi:hypothetical protein